MLNTVNNPLAGSKKLLTKKGMEELMEALAEECDDPIAFAFLQGFNAGICFPTIPKKAETYGMGAKDFAVNGLRNTKDAIIKEAIGGSNVNVTIIDLGRKPKGAAGTEGDAE